jgi:hypothetical protein
MGKLSDFERGQIVGGRLAAAPVMKTAALLRASRGSEEEQCAKINTDRKISSYIGKVCFENDSPTAA